MNAGEVGGQILAAGLVDTIAMDLVPVVNGSGRRFFGSIQVPPDPSRTDLAVARPLGRPPRRKVPGAYAGRGRPRLGLVCDVLLTRCD